MNRSSVQLNNRSGRRPTSWIAVRGGIPLMVGVAVGPAPALDLGATTPLFQTRALFPGSIFRMNYDVSGDGKRFLVSTPVEGAGTSPITVVMNWAAAFGK